MLLEPLFEIHYCFAQRGLSESIDTLGMQIVELRGLKRDCMTKNRILQLSARVAVGLQILTQIQLFFEEIVNIFKDLEDSDTSNNS